MTGSTTVVATVVVAGAGAAASQALSETAEPLQTSTTPETQTVSGQTKGTGWPWPGDPLSKADAVT